AQNGNALAQACRLALMLLLGWPQLQGRDVPRHGDHSAENGHYGRRKLDGIVELHGAFPSPGSGRPPDAAGAYHFTPRRSPCALAFDRRRTCTPASATTSRNREL